ncbi:MAG: DUF4124 domain-containing protein [Betaproteobacteria bacterium]|nr:DUF4124 domain-containing protein [Betaproteobacteria bacterium]
MRPIHRSAFVTLVVATSLVSTAHAQNKRPPAVAKVTVPGAAQEPVGTTIYKHVDERGHVTYSNRPMKGAEVVELEPITVIPGGVPTPARPAVSNFQIQQPAASASGSANGTVALAASVSAAAGGPQQVALVQPIPTSIPANVLPNIDAATQKTRDDGRRKILEDEMKAEQKLLADAVLTLSATESDRTVIEQMRQAATKLTPAAYAEARRNYEQREEKLKTLQETVSTHEKNVSALKKELAALR